MGEFKAIEKVVKSTMPVLSGTQWEQFKDERTGKGKPQQRRRAPQQRQRSGAGGSRRAA
jgi:hypothetical protein